jgi:hypothetical protein
MKSFRVLGAIIAAIGLLPGAFIGGAIETSHAQTPNVIVRDNSKPPAKPVTIPVVIRVKGVTPEPELQFIDLTITEDGEPQSILSIRSQGMNSPLALEVLVQDDVVSVIGNEMKTLAEFVEKQPKGSRVLTGYLRSGSLQVRQRFTSDLEKAAKSFRIPTGLASSAPFNPYVELIEAIKKFDSQPMGRRAILLISDGLDVSRGAESSSPAESLDLQRAIREAQRRGVAVYSFYAPTVGSEGNLGLINNAQGCLQRLGDETGGHAYVQGTGPPVSFDPSIRELRVALEKQAAVTYLSTHLNKGFHKIEVRSSTPGVGIAHPSGHSR